MEIAQIKELLNTPAVKEVVEAEIKLAAESKQKELDAQITALAEDRQKAKKELFIHKKMVLAKSTLYEEKLKALYEDKLNTAVKQMSTDVFSFINESVNKLTTAVAGDAKAQAKGAKLTEAFSQAMRIMAPYVNINELAESNNTSVETLKTRLNSALAENADLRGKLLSDEVSALVVKECAGYPLEKQVVIVNALKKLSPKTLTEAKTGIDQIKHTLRAKTEEQHVAEGKNAQPTVVVESADEAKSRLQKLAEDVKRQATQDKSTALRNASERLDPLDIF